jgi:hypothetical protein
MPPPYPGGLYTPDSFGPPPPEDQFGDEEYERWHATYRRWRSDLAALCDAVVPEEARDSKYLVDSGWVLFLSMCVLFDPPETRLVEFADRIGWRYSNVIPRGKHVGNAPPIVWLRDADRAETAMREFYEGLLVEVLERYVHPYGVTTEDAIGSIRKERPELFERLMRGMYDNESRPYIDPKPHHRKKDILSAYTLLREHRAVPPQPSKRSRDSLIALQCAILYDDHNGPNPEDRRVRIFTHKRLARMFGLQGPRAAKDYIELGREIRKNRTAK